VERAPLALAIAELSPEQLLHDEDVLEDVTAVARRSWVIGHSNHDVAGVMLRAPTPRAGQSWLTVPRLGHYEIQGFGIEH
jgi:hypothetical protein